MTMGENFMRRCAIVLASTIIAFLFLQCAAIEERATISPQTPRVGDEIRVFYRPSAQGAVLAQATEITLQALIVRSEGMPVLKEIPLQHKDGIWQTSFQLSEEKAQALLFKFVSGDLTDDNNAHAWNVMVVGKDNRPLRGALLWHGQFLNSGSYMDFQGRKNPAAGMADMRRELDYYPDNIRAYASLWSAELSARPGDETKSQVRKKVEAVYEAQKNNQEALVTLFGWMMRVGDKDQAEAARKAWMAKDPKGKVAETVRQSEIFAQRDPDKKAELIDKFLADFPKKPADASMYGSNLLNAYLQAGNFDKVDMLLGKQETPSSSTLNSMAWAVIEKGDKKPELEKAVTWARRGIDIAKSGKEERPSYMPRSQWKESKDFSLGMITDTYALGLFKIGRKKEAEDAYAEAVGLTGGKEIGVDERYLEACVSNGNDEKAVSAATGFLQEGVMSDRLMELFRTAYARSKGSDKGFDEMVHTAKLAALEKVRKELLKRRIDKPAAEFALKGLDGTTIRLADLRGKVVVVDFWATWCGPCKESFPYLQKMYEKYRENPNVRIYALDTWEDESGARREELVKKFLAENHYTFPVLYDEGMVEKYGVDGIPTKFILDKDGKIQFKSVGFSNGQKMMDEMTLAIDMLLNNDPAAAK
jgi:thiol-disulfide isomerase/thioredoxin